MRHFKSLIVFTILIIVIAVACEKKKEAVLVEVGKTAITQQDLDLLLKVNPRLERRLATPAGRKQILENYVAQALMYQEAKKQGLDQDPLVQAKLELYGKVILAQSLLEERLDEATEKYFNEHKDEFERVKLAHIYIPFKTKQPNRALSKDVKVTRSEEDAKKLSQELYEKLKKDPSQFDAFVKKYSEDARTQKRNGDLGWLTKKDARMERWGWSPVIEKAYNLKADAISEPIQSENGFHVVKVLEDKKVEDYNQVKARIRFKIQSQVKSALVEELKQKYPVHYVEETPEPASQPSKKVETDKTEEMKSGEDAPNQPPAE